MGMYPNPAKTLWLSTGIDLLIKEISYGRVLEGHMGPGADLLHQPDVFHQQQIIRSRDAETTHLGLTIVTQKQ